MALFMVLAACYGVLQLAVLGWPARSVRVVTLLLAVPVGAYGCGLLAVLLEYAYTRVVAAANDDPTYRVILTASYTVDPFIEELVKVSPLLLLALVSRLRLQWGFTDHVLLGAAFGSGFALLEAMLRFSTRIERVLYVRMPG